MTCDDPPAAEKRGAPGRETVCEAGEHIAAVAGEEKSEEVDPEGPKEMVLAELADWKVRSYCSEPDRGWRRREGKKAEQAAVYANRRRIRGERGKRLLRQGARSWNGALRTCMKRAGCDGVHLRRHPNILKHLLVHVAAFNLGLIVRKFLGRGTPRGLQGYDRALFLTLLPLLREVWASPRVRRECAIHREPLEPPRSLPEPSTKALLFATKKTVSTTGF